MRAMAMVPTYNEAPNIEQLLREILQQGPDIGAVVVDDASPTGRRRLWNDCGRKTRGFI